MVVCFILACLTRCECLKWPFFVSNTPSVTCRASTVLSLHLRLSRIFRRSFMLNMCLWVHWLMLVARFHVLPLSHVSLQHPDEERYKFATPSTMKPTQITCSEGAVNQIPAWVEMKGIHQISLNHYLSHHWLLAGDIRLTPFYDVEECIAKVKGYMEELNKGKLAFCCWHTE